MGDWLRFRPCLGCSYDVATGDGERGCGWSDCPYLPAELDVFCPNCRFNFFTREGNSLCGRPGVCEHSTEPRANVEHIRAWLAAVI